VTLTLTPEFQLVTLTLTPEFQLVTLTLTSEFQLLTLTLTSEFQLVTLTLTSEFQLLTLTLTSDRYSFVSFPVSLANLLASGRSCPAYLFPAFLRYGTATREESCSKVNEQIRMPG